MNLLNIGSISNYAKLRDLEIKWSLRKRDPNLPKQDENPQIAQIKRQAEEQRKSNNINAITGKLKAGMKLTDSELEYLRKNSPDYYEKAIKIEREREDYKKALKRCRSKEDVDKLRLRTLSQFASEAKAISSNASIPKDKKIELLEFIGMRVAASNSEHVEFQKSSEYFALPDTNDDKKARRKPRNSEDEFRKLREALRRLQSRLERDDSRRDRRVEYVEHMDKSAEAAEPDNQVPAESGEPAIELPSEMPQPPDCGIVFPRPGKPQSAGSSYRPSGAPSRANRPEPPAKPKVSIKA